MPSQSSDPLATAQAFYEAMGRGDIPAALGLMAPGIVWNEAEDHPLAGGNPFVGPGAVVEGVFSQLVSLIDDFRVEVGELLPSGDRVVMLGRYHGVGKASGAELNAQVVHVWTVVDNKLSAFQQYTNTANWAAVLKG